MQQIFPDLWQSAPERPYANVPSLVTRAYLLQTSAGNFLIYSTGLAEELDAIEGLGGIQRQYLSHVDEAGPALAAVKQRFGAQLWSHAVEANAIGEKSGVTPDRTFAREEVHEGGLRVFPTPGHTPGSSCYLYESGAGGTYLFTGDTIGIDASGRWMAGYLPGMSDKQQLLATLARLEALNPDVVLSSAFGEHHPYRTVTPAEWRQGLREAAERLSRREVA